MYRTRGLLPLPYRPLIPPHFPEIIQDDGVKGRPIEGKKLEKKKAEEDDKREKQGGSVWNLSHG